MGLTEDLDQLATSIRQLQARWDMYFSGVEKRPPNEVHARVEKLIREYDRSVIRNNADRFRLQGLVSRFNTLNELWQKRLRAREEGRAFGLHGRQAAVAPAGPAPTTHTSKSFLSILTPPARRIASVYRAMQVRGLSKIGY